MSSEPIPFSFIAELPLAGAAFAYAQEMHRGQRRASDDAPFILHPLEVASLLHNTGHSETTVAAGILHDTIETQAPPPRHRSALRPGRGSPGCCAD